jgi:hypothetical protein
MALIERMVLLGERPITNQTFRMKVIAAAQELPRR